MFVILLFYNQCLQQKLTDFSYPVTKKLKSKTHRFYFVPNTRFNKAVVCLAGFCRIAASSLAI
jgi:hypothetical protein